MRASGIDSLTQKITLSDIAVYAADAHPVSVSTLLAGEGPVFKRASHFNFGVTHTDHWVKFSLENTSAKTLRFYLVMESSTNNSLLLYTVKNGRVIHTEATGEETAFNSRFVRHRNPVMELVLLPHDSTSYYLFAKGSGEPLNVSAHLLSPQAWQEWNTDASFFSGGVYGILLLIMVLNISFYIVTKERVYIVFFFQLLCGWLCICCFDGFIYQYVFPTSPYWINQTAPVTLCLTYIFSNFFVAEYYNLKVLSPFLAKSFHGSSFCIAVILLVSFIHPAGFNFFILAMLVMTTVTAVLLSLAVVEALKKGFRTYFFAMLATICVIIAGSVYQLYFLGVLPDTFISHHAMHLAVLTEAVFMALAVNDKFRAIREENMRYQQQLVLVLKEYSQNLITTIEEERQRLAIDIHDSLGQNLLAMRNKILLTQRQKQIPGELEEDLELLLHTTSETLDEVRAISYNLRPPILNAMGLTAAVHSLTTKIRTSTHLKVELNIDDTIDGLLLKKLEINVYRILQEAFNNVVKHAGASKVVLDMRVAGNQLLILFADDGNGFDSRATKGQGMLGMEERVAILNGNFSIRSDKTTGTELRIDIALNR